MVKKPIVELGVAEAHAILAARPDGEDLPPLEAIENEDWGRDLLLSRFLEMPAEELAALGLSLENSEFQRGFDRAGEAGQSG